MIIGIKTFQTEYNKMPEELSPVTLEDSTHRSRGALLKTLMAKDPKTNPRHIDFYDPPVAKGGHYGLYEDENKDPVVVDSWGEPLYLVMGSNSAKKVPNPDPRDNKEHPFVEGSVIMFSSGPDRDPKTWEDNVLSWK